MTATKTIMNSSRCNYWKFFVVVVIAFVVVVFPHVTSAFIGTPTRTRANYHHQQRHKLVSLNGVASSTLHARPFINNDDENGMEREFDALSRLDLSNPTDTYLASLGPKIDPTKPKIVVLGASGKIGRLVVRQLLETKMDITVIALVRDPIKASKVLFENLMVRVNIPGRSKLQIVQCDLVPPEELPGYETSAAYLEQEAEWKARAESAAAFYNTSMSKYDDRDSTTTMTDHVNEILQDAIKGSSVIINCIGSVRPTNIWTDIISRPLWRLLKKDVSGWCGDGHHPYYTHYCTTRKLLSIAEREQLRREAIANQLDDVDDTKNNNNNNNNNNKPKEVTPRIRMIRISDKCVDSPPWGFVPLILNTFHSMVFRYHEMADQLMEQSSLVETIVLRPGDLIDDERDINTTALEIDPFKTVPDPARVGREDVASLAISCALFHTNATQPNIEEINSIILQEPFHYTFSLRWVGTDLDPYPAQGTMKDGHIEVQSSLKRALSKLKRQKRLELNKLSKFTSSQYPTSSTTVNELVTMVQRYAISQQSRKRKQGKPYGICVAIPIYFTLWLMAKSLLWPLVQYVPGSGTFLPMFTKFQTWFYVSASLVLGRMTHFITTNSPPILRRMFGLVMKHVFSKTKIQYISF